MRYMDVNGFCKLQTVLPLNRFNSGWWTHMWGFSESWVWHCQVSCLPDKLTFLLMHLFVLELSAFLGSIPHNISFKLNITRYASDFFFYQICFVLCSWENCYSFHVCHNNKSLFSQQFHFNTLLSLTGLLSWAQRPRTLQGFQKERSV